MLHINRVCYVFSPFRATFRIYSFSSNYYTPVITLSVATTDSREDQKHLENKSLTGTSFSKVSTDSDGFGLKLPITAMLCQYSIFPLYFQVLYLSQKKKLLKQSLDSKTLLFVITVIIIIKKYTSCLIVAFNYPVTIKLIN